MGILESDSEAAQQLHEQALEILTELAFDDSFTKPGSGESASACMLNKLFETLRSIFLEEKEGNSLVAEADREKAIRLRGKAGEALARLLAVHDARGLNVADILSTEEAIKLLTKVIRYLCLYLFRKNSSFLRTTHSPCLCIIFLFEIFPRSYSQFLR